MRAIAILATCLTVGTAHVAAAEEAAPNAKLKELMPALVGMKACYARAYDAKHLAAHPKQRVTQMTLFLRVVGISESGDWVLDPTAKYDRLNYQFALSAQRRGERRALVTNGYCSDSKNVFCARECDGGGVALEKIAGAEALMLKLEDRGILTNGCDETKGKWLAPGTDDKAFRLDKVAAAQCAALEKAEFGN